MISLYVVSACKYSSSDVSKTEEYLKGELIAKRICGSCHIYTPPELLDQISWPNVLSVMKNEMMKSGQPLDYEEWIEVQRFYQLYAPKFFQSEGVSQPKPQELFKITPLDIDSNYLSRSTMLHLDENSNSFIVGQENGTILDISQKGVNDKFRLPNIPIDFDGNYFLGMGNLGPSQQPKGVLYSKVDSNFISQMDSLTRPVHLNIFDLNNDGQNELIISEFGSNIGKETSGGLLLGIMQNKKLTTMKIDDQTGCTQTRIVDMNDDGLVDILALYSQGNEMIKIFYNQGNFDFKSTVIANFPPVYGTNSFDLADMDDDGDLDLFITNGDNDDYSQIFKAYHGIRIFKNMGNNIFEEVIHDRINGASKVLTSDFDLDGDIDFVVLAMYPDLFSRPWEALHYYENLGKFKFQKYYFESPSDDNWILMECGDLDGDGDTDIITAAHQGIHGLIAPQLLREWKNKPIGIRLWENKTN